MSHPVYDKAEWHYNGDFPSDLPPSQAYMHAGMFLGWLIERDLLSEEFAQQFAPALEEFRQHRRTGPQLFEQMGETLAEDMLSEEGNAFARQYYRKQYFDDYFDELGSLVDSVYHVNDTWENYEIIREVIDRRYARWKHQS